MGQLSETLETIREHLRAAADESQRYILSAETREEQVAAVLRTHTLARLGLVRLVRESVEHEPDGGRRATIESEATAAGRELLWVLDGNAPAGTRSRRRRRWQGCEFRRRAARTVTEHPGPLGGRRVSGHARWASIDNEGGSR